METDREIRLGDWWQGAIERGTQDPQEDSSNREDKDSGGEKPKETALVFNPGGMTDEQRFAHLRMMELLPVTTHAHSWEVIKASGGGGRSAAQCIELKRDIKFLWEQGLTGYEISKRLKCARYTVYKHIRKLERKE